MAERKCPVRRQATDDDWPQSSASKTLEGLDEAIERAIEKLVLVAETDAVLRDTEGMRGTEVILVPTPIQREILKALDGRLLKKKDLETELCGGHGNRLYRKGEIQELMRLGLVAKRRSGGYYRPDAPPPNTLVGNL